MARRGCPRFEGRLKFDVGKGAGGDGSVADGADVIAGGDGPIRGITAGAVAEEGVAIGINAVAVFVLSRVIALDAIARQRGVNAGASSGRAETVPGAVIV